MEEEFSTAGDVVKGTSPGNELGGRGGQDGFREVTATLQAEMVQAC